MECAECFVHELKCTKWWWCNRKLVDNTNGSATAVSTTRRTSELCWVIRPPLFALSRACPKVHSNEVLVLHHSTRYEVSSSFCSKVGDKAHRLQSLCPARCVFMPHPFTVCCLLKWSQRPHTTSQIWMLRISLLTSWAVSISVHTHAYLGFGFTHARTQNPLESRCVRAQQEPRTSWLNSGVRWSPRLHGPRYDINIPNRRLEAERGGLKWYHMIERTWFLSSPQLTLIVLLAPLPNRLRNLRCSFLCPLVLAPLLQTESCHLIFTYGNKI